jgi:hypothetical protein
MREAGNLVRMRDIININLVGKPEVKSHFGDIDIDG